jgi:hypothetical protein
VLRGGPQLCEGVARDLLGGGQEAEDAAAAVVHQHHRQRRPGTCTMQAQFQTPLRCSASEGVCQQLMPMPRVSRSRSCSCTVDVRRRGCCSGNCTTLNPQP